MADIRIARSAREQIDALNDIDARSVDAALQVLDTRPGRPINLPGAPAGTSYLAIQTNPGPVIIYRPRLPTEGKGWLVLALLSKEQYKDVRYAEDLAATTPAVRELVQAIVSGTVSTASASADPGSQPATQPGAASTNPAAAPRP